MSSLQFYFIGARIQYHQTSQIPNLYPSFSLAFTLLVCLSAVCEPVGPLCIDPLRSSYIPSTSNWPAHPISFIVSALGSPQVSTTVHLISEPFFSILSQIETSHNAVTYSTSPIKNWLIGLSGRHFRFMNEASMILVPVLHPMQKTINTCHG